MGLQLFSTEARQLDIFTNSSWASSPALTIFFFFFFLFVCLFYNNHPNQSEVNSHCSFDLHFPTGYWQSSIFSCAFWYIFFAEMSIRVFCSLLNWLVVHCWVVGVLHVFWILHVSHRCPANIFFHPMGYLLTLLWCLKVLSSNGLQLPMFSLIACTFGVMSEKSFPKLMSWGLPAVFSWNFITLGLTFRFQSRFS